MSNKTDKWQQLEKALSGVLYANVRALADGHELAFYKRLNGEKLVVQVYVDGWIKGEWFEAKDGEPVYPQARFWCPKKSRVWKLRRYKELKKVFGKKKADEMTALRTVCFMPYWNSPRSLVRHLKKHFPDLELVTDSESNA